VLGADLVHLEEFVLLGSVLAAVELAGTALGALPHRLLQRLILSLGETREVPLLEELSRETGIAAPVPFEGAAVAEGYVLPIGKPPLTIHSVLREDHRPEHCSSSSHSLLHLLRKIEAGESNPGGGHPMAAVCALRGGEGVAAAGGAAAWSWSGEGVGVAGGGLPGGCGHVLFDCGYIMRVRRREEWQGGGVRWVYTSGVDGAVAGESLEVGCELCFFDEEAKVEGVDEVGFEGVDVLFWYASNFGVELVAVVEVVEVFGGEHEGGDEEAGWGQDYRWMLK
jgi:hypothetical protein